MTIAVAVAVVTTIKNPGFDCQGFVDFQHSTPKFDILQKYAASIDSFDNSSR